MLYLQNQHCLSCPLSVASVVLLFHSVPLSPPLPSSSLFVLPIFLAVLHSVLILFDHFPPLILFFLNALSLPSLLNSWPRAMTCSSKLVYQILIFFKILSVLLPTLTLRLLYLQHLCLFDL